MTRLPALCCALMGVLLATLPAAAGVNASVEFTVTQDWGTAANVTLRIRNHGTTALPAWPLEFDYARTLTTYNNAVVSSRTGNHYVLNKESYYPATIPAGGSLYFDGRVEPGSVGGAEPMNITLAGQSIGGPALRIADASVLEGDSGTVAMVFNVTLTEAPAAGQSVQATFATAPDTATAGVDYTSATGPLVFAAGETAKTISVTVTGDTDEEPDERFTVTLSGVTGAAVEDGSAVGTILNDDVVIGVKVKGTTVFEGDSGTTPALVTVSLDRPALSAVSVQARTEAGTASAGSDFVATTQTVNFAIGESVKTVSILIVGDTVPEATESFTVKLSLPSEDLAIIDGSAKVTIYDNDGASFGSVVINEVCAAPGSRSIRWEDNGTPRLGMGTPWMASAFDDAAWETGALPAGFGVGGLGTDLGPVMNGITPSLYLRKNFTVTAAQATAAGNVTLQIDYDDGFIAYLNGVEVARANMGPVRHFCYAHQPAYNARPSTATQTFTLGLSTALLVAGTNVLAIQAHNAVINPATNDFDLSPTFRINAGLTLTSPAATFIPLGAAGGAWKLFPGLAEPSGGVIDPVLLSGAYVPLPGDEGDFKNTADFSDWVELRNTGTAPVNVGGWALSDDPAAATKWRFPADTVIPASGHLLVLCDDREEANGFTQPTRRALITAGATWRYYDLIAAPPANWNAAAFTDTAWSSGAAPLGYSPNNEDGAATVIAGGSNTHLTDYFRRSFTVADPAAITVPMTLRFQRDDGLVVWLNGTELARDNMPAGVPTHTTTAAANVANEAGWVAVNVPPDALVAGANVLAVEVHQNSTGSSDSRFNLELSAWEQLPGARKAMIHAGFSLNADGEPLALHDPDGGLVDALPSWPKQDSHFSWGRSLSNPALLGYQSATPGAANAPATLAARVASPEFLQAGTLAPLPSGFYAANQSLVLRCATPGSTIRYTTDGSDPLATGNGTTYTAPVAISRPNEKTAVIIRAKAFAPGFLPSKDIAQTFLINQHAAIRTLPVISLVENAGRSFFLPEGIMAINGGTFDGEQKWQPGTIASYNVPHSRGSSTERRTSVELIHPDGRPGFRDKVNVRMAGSGYTRPRYRMQYTADSPWRLYAPTEKGSMNLIWRSEIGASALNHEVFPGWPTTSFEQLRLRAGNNDPINPFICDEYVRRLFGEMGHDSLRGLFAMLYVNGSFKGIYNLAERLRNETFQNHFGSKNDWDVKYNSEYSAGDATEHTRFRTLYEQDMGVAANYTTMKQAADLANFADYYLLNIYANMWDWATWGAGANNYVLYRERVPNGIWRFTVWDAEGGFFNQNYFNAPSFDLITQNLTGADDTNELARLWKYLVGVPPFNTGATRGSPEFRLLVADRIQRHFFNGGLLDDRATTTRVHTLKNELRDTVRDGVAYMAGSWNEAWFTSWVNATTGRRAHLLGPTASQFTNAGVWPATPPPALSQHGGNVALGQSITVTGTPAGATVYYTTDGSDPRLTGGTVAPGARTYAGGVPINLPLILLARTRSGTGEWSALTEARFSVPLTPPVPGSIVISEIMYHPPGPSAAEATAGFLNPDDFEFLRLTNTGATPLGIANLRLADGVGFDFSTAGVAALAPGASVLVVKHRAAFNLRYGNGFDTLIAGTYTGNLRNSGETVRLDLAGAGATVLDSVTYDDAAPWPLSPDGFGPSLVRDTAGNWFATAHPGGHPGGAPRPLTYAQWAALSFPSNIPADATPLGDPDHDGIRNFLEYALGGTARLADASALQPVTGILDINGQPHLTLTYPFVPTATEATVTPETTTDLQQWSGTGLISGGAPTSAPSGQSRQTVRFPTPAIPSALYIHLRAE